VANAPGIDDVLDRERQAVEQAERLACRQLALGGLRRGHSLIAAQRDEAVQLALQLLGPRQRRAHHFDGRYFLAANACAELDRRQETKIFAHFPKKCSGEPGIVVCRRRR
jgi:hypothetical protein